MQLPRQAFVESKMAYELLSKEQLKRMDEELRKSVHGPREKRYKEISSICHMIDLTFLAFLGALVLPWFLNEYLYLVAVPGALILLAVMVLLSAMRRFSRFLQWQED